MQNPAILPHLVKPEHLLALVEFVILPLEPLGFARQLTPAATQFWKPVKAVMMETPLAVITARQLA
jgi:hypothetical protein